MNFLIAFQAFKAGLHVLRGSANKTNFFKEEGVEKVKKSKQGREEVKTKTDVRASDIKKKTTEGSILEERNDVEKVKSPK